MVVCRSSDAFGKAETVTLLLSERSNGGECAEG